MGCVAGSPPVPRRQDRATRNPMSRGRRARRPRPGAGTRRQHHAAPHRHKEPRHPHVIGTRRRPARVPPTRGYSTPTRSPGERCNDTQHLERREGGRSRGNGVPIEPPRSGCHSTTSRRAPLGRTARSTSLDDTPATPCRHRPLQAPRELVVLTCRSELWAPSAHPHSLIGSRPTSWRGGAALPRSIRVWQLRGRSHETRSTPSQARWSRSTAG